MSTNLRDAALRLFTARVHERGLTLSLPDLALAPEIGAEGFRIEDTGGGVRLTGGDERGLLYGLGKLLRDPAWRGTSVPRLPVRGIYFATHFHNWYHDAPIAEVERYVEDLALWGINSLQVWFDMHHYSSLEEPAAEAMLARLRAILQAGQRVGMAAGLGSLANEGYAGGPPELRATWGRGDFYLPAHYHTELCPHAPGGLDLILRWAEERMAAFADLGIEYYWLWPYDQGGCCCPLCHPWGANGFLYSAERVARRARQVLPGVKIVLATWDYDAYWPGEWDALDRALAAGTDWADLILADGRDGHYPDYPVAHGSPGGLPLVGFPEISMYGGGPWGGFGANPYPALIQGLWDQGKAILSGGWPYSEGIFDDLNKVVCAQFYWDPDRPAAETVREYAAWEFAPEAAEEVAAAIGILERTLPRRRETRDGITRWELAAPAGAEQAQALLRSAEAKLGARARDSWRWRILALRGLLDAELVRHEGMVSERAEAALEELTGIYHAEHACSWVAPPTREALRADRSA
jgi:hypothetical protein